MAETKLTLIVEQFSLNQFSRGDYVLTANTVCRQYHFLYDGYMRSYTSNTEGAEVSLAFYSPDNVVCEIFSFFKRVAAKENIVCLTDCKVLSLSFDELQHVFHSMPEFREFGRTILVNSYGALKQRMLNVIQLSAEDRYRHLLQTNPEIFQHAPLKHIASYLGVTDTSLSRIRKEISHRI